jgi:hypothetical protein
VLLWADSTVGDEFGRKALILMPRHRLANQLCLLSAASVSLLTQLVQFCSGNEVLVLIAFQVIKPLIKLFAQAPKERSHVLLTVALPCVSESIQRHKVVLDGADI